jgi:hypothetical protein
MTKMIVYKSANTFLTNCRSLRFSDTTYWQMSHTPTIVCSTSFQCSPVPDREIRIMYLKLSRSADAPILCGINNVSLDDYPQ